MRILIIGLDSSYVPNENWGISEENVKYFTTIEEAIGQLRVDDSVGLIMIRADADISWLKGQLCEIGRTIPMIAFGIDTDAKTAVNAIRSGAREFLPLPADRDLVRAILAGIEKKEKEFVFEDPQMRNLLGLAQRVAPADATVLITGESGTGKEMIARYIHQQSRRREERFVSVNCAAIPESLLESELFGHEKGAFTGASSRRIGKFEEADGGTLLLDEISEMDPRLQAKLLRAIQEREIDRIGSSKAIKIDIRLIATSNRDLTKAVSDGHFREDLLFRLNVVELNIPPLRTRPGDIIPLSKLFAKRYSDSNNTIVKSIDDQASQKLLKYQWPGNVRELENCIHRAVLLSDSMTIKNENIILPTQADDTALSESRPNHATDFVGRSMAAVEKSLILDTLHHTFGNRTHAATILGISIRTLRNKLRQYDKEGAMIPPSGMAVTGTSSEHP